MPSHKHFAAQAVGHLVVSSMILIVAPLMVMGQASGTGGEPKPELILQSAHSSVVTSIAFHSSGELLASVSTDGTLKLWKLSEGYLLQTIAVPQLSNKQQLLTPQQLSAGPLYNVVFRPDGKGVVTTNWTGVVSMKFGEPNRYFLRGGIVEGGLVIDPRGQWIAAASEAGTIAILDSNDLHVLRTLDDHGGPILAVAVSPDGSRLISGGIEKTLILWDPIKGEKLKVLKGHTDYVRALTFSGDGKTVVSASDDKTIKLWDTHSGHLKKTLVSDSEVQAVACSRDGRLIASAGENYQVKVWDTISGQSVKVWSTTGSPRLLDFQTANTHKVKWNSGGLAFSPDSHSLAVGNFGQIKVFDVSDASSIKLSLTMGNNANVRGARFSPEGRYLAVADSADVKTWDLRSGAVRSYVWVQGEQLGFGDIFDFSPDGKFLAAGYDSGLVRIWNAENSRIVRTLEVSPKISIRGVNFSVDGKLLGAANNDGTTKIWNASSGNEIQTLNLSLNKGVPSLVFHRDGKWLATASTRGESITIWDVLSGQKIGDLDCQRSKKPSPSVATPRSQLTPANIRCGVYRLAIDRISGSLAASGNFGASVWPGPDWKEIGKDVLGSTEGGTAISPGGQLWVWDKFLWDFKNRNAVVNLGNYHYSPSFSADSKWLVSVGEGEAALWDIEKGKAAAFLVSRDHGNWLVTSPDGLFDGSPGAYTDIIWRFSDRIADVLPVEAFFTDFYYPGLLAEILAGKSPSAPRDLAQVDRRQPAVKLIRLDEDIPGVMPSRTITLSVEIESAPPDSKHPNGSGVRDVRLFRNGSLVKIWHGEAPDRTNYQIKVPVIAGTNQFTAYAFNDSNVKSRDARLTVAGAKSLERKGVEYIIGIGINRYANSNYDLRYATQDAQAFSEELKRQQVALDRYSRVEVVELFDKDAVRTNILATLQRLAGADVPQEVPDAVRRLPPAQPEDAVFVYYAGHGTSANSHFYMIPYDLGYTGRRDELDEAGLHDILQRSISDEELLQGFEAIDAGRLIMVIDACNSGQALESEEKRRGPMNSKGLAQLAYEKGMYILTASEGYQEALEEAQLGHGLLTYALVEEGLKTDRADVDPRDGEIDVREWLDYAARRVPEIQDSLASRGRQLEHGNGVPDNEQAIRQTNDRHVQHPRVFYRREPDVRPLVIAKLPNVNGASNERIPDQR